MLSNIPGMLEGHANGQDYKCDYKCDRDSCEEALKAHLRQTRAVEKLKAKAKAEN